MILETNRLIIREYTPSDFDDLYSNKGSKSDNVLIFSMMCGTKGMFGMIISIGTDNSVPTSVTTEQNIILLNKLQDR